MISTGDLSAGDRAILRAIIANARAAGGRLDYPLARRVFKSRMLRGDTFALSLFGALFASRVSAAMTELEAPIAPETPIANSMADLLAFGVDCDPATLYGVATDVSADHDHDAAGLVRAIHDDHGDHDAHHWLHSRLADPTFATDFSRRHDGHGDHGRHDAHAGATARRHADHGAHADQADHAGRNGHAEHAGHTSHGGLGGQNHGSSNHERHGAPDAQGSHDHGAPHTSPAPAHDHHESRHADHSTHRESHDHNADAHGGAAHDHHAQTHAGHEFDLNDAIGAESSTPDITPGLAPGDETLEAVLAALAPGPDVPPQTSHADYRDDHGAPAAADQGPAHGAHGHHGHGAGSPPETEFGGAIAMQAFAPAEDLAALSQPLI
ncbi:MAG: hypothetical protein AAFW81_00525 [Pseudomonadota bacterium]